MPTYEYKCEKCGHRFDVFQSMKDDRLTDCPVEACGGSVKRLIGTGAGIIFKGSGFYQTDYRSESYKQAAKSDSGGTGGGDSGGSSAPTSAPAPAAAPSTPSTGSGGTTSTGS